MHQKAQMLEELLGIIRVIHCEAAAAWLYRTFLLAERNYKKNPVGFSIHIKWLLENKDAYIGQAESEEGAAWGLLANIWLLQKENLMPCDDFNRVVFIYA